MLLKRRSLTDLYKCLMLYGIKIPQNSITTVKKGGFKYFFNKKLTKYALLINIILLKSRLKTILFYFII